MAKRFGGKYSPQGQRADGPRAQAQHAPMAVKPGWRVSLLYLPAVVLAFTSLNESPVMLATGLVGAGVLTLAAWLLQEGLKAEAAYHARKVARRPAVPRKVFATVLTGLGAGIAAYTGGAGLIGAGIYALAAAGLHTAAFGIDPLTDKRMEGVDTFQQDRVAKVVDEAEAHLDIMLSQITGLSDRRLTERVQGFQTIARRMIRTVEEDPRDLTGARKFLGVYLMGAKDATVKFVDLYGRNKDADARASYEALLDDLEQNFAARTEKMLLDDRSDMDIEINVLRDRLQLEGVSLKTKGDD
ncbi:MAG: 5-bromo-4-chloroindolyl phosphate hydrolysis family protein [Pseudomonadota bacterium]